jgi:methionyl-tRNA formyltransferase
MLTKAMGEISFEQSAVVIERLIRGLNPWPSAYTHLDNKLLKIWDADVVESQGDFVPGQVSSVQKNGFTVRTGQGDLQIHSLQLEGKKRMDAESFLRGFPLKTGQQLG